MRTVLDGIRTVADAGGLPVADLPAAQKVGHELEAAAVPGVEERARRRLAIQFLDREGDVSTGMLGDVASA